MKIIKKYKDFLYEAKGQINPDALIILDAIQNTPQGKLLQRLLQVKPTGTGTHKDFDKVFQPVRTGRVYINGSYGGKTRIQKEENSWCQSSESSGTIYGKECFRNVEDVVRYSAFRYLTLGLEIGISKKIMLEWINNNEQRVYGMKDYNEIIETFKKEMGFSNMITDPSVIENLPSYKRLEKLLDFGKSFDGISFLINPLGIEDVQKALDSAYYRRDSLTMRIKMSNKKEFKVLYNQGFEVIVYIGSDNIDDLDAKFLKGIIYSIQKIYDSEVSRGIRNLGGSQNSIMVAKEILIALIKGENNEEMKNYLIKISNENPMLFAGIFKKLQEINPDVANTISTELGDQNVKSIIKGSDVLRSFGIGDD